MYFNSASKKIRLNAEISDGTMDVSLYSFAGQLLEKKRIFGGGGVVDSVDVFSTRGLVPGMYMVKVETEDAVQSDKILVHN
ncbi:Por secretion system C-terminal sorting domain-containing protein [Mariniphaga anaerophila]|uniref:Por secretion system C-terminal sorting domain-containing protein n=1 Tax=Mariniphaga anaerophila TaxID=1484053 RepID=A0A1M4WM72_9BACT|nr:T9SS type A sorting domain-containing protein [Mariniphaga anaerophila]SHE82336.1 Por secretion system C-terminal sorting domain-containing protein [Mariniphaga anaerophila]